MPTRSASSRRRATTCRAASRRWVVTIVGVFGAIHFYTQWFERLGATPMSVLIAGLTTLAVAIVIWMLRSRKLATA